MPITPTYPGVYVQELPSPVHAITGVATSIAAFVGYTARGIDNRAEAIYSFSDFERLFGGLASNSEVSYAVQQFFQNGGSQAYVVRAPMHYGGASPVPCAQVVFGDLTFSALSSGQWANGQLLIDVDVRGLDLSTATGDQWAFNLTVTNLMDGTTESFPSVTLDRNRQNFVGSVVNDPDNGSQLVGVSVASLPNPPTAAVVVTGILGTALASTVVSGTSYLETVNSALGGGNTVTAANQDASVSLSLPNVPASPLTIKVIGKGVPIPQTVQGLATQLQQGINSALSIAVPGAYVVATASPSGTGSGIRVNAFLPNQPDAVIGFPALSVSGVSDAAAALGLGAASPPASVNVAHYALGTTTASQAETSSTPATAPSGLPTSTELVGDPAAFTGIYALMKVDLFNLLCIPEAARASSSDPNALDTTINPVEIYSAAIALCDLRRALLLVDPPPNVNSVAGAVDWKSNTIGVVDANGAAFFPRLRLADPLNNGQLRTFAPSGIVAGVYSSTDSARGVWKAPAGIEATLNGVQNMTYQLNDAENGTLNPLGLNCFRTFPLYGPILWGARTLVGADAMTSQWKYVPVRRTALYLEESLYRGTKWVVFEPNDEPLWAAIRLNVGSFMQGLFQKGAFQGKTPDQAYFVKCDGETTTQTDIDLGIVNILVGFAPLKPAEFVVISIEQLTGQAGS
ncbi:MAG TPA: phage tail sheath C-terminal domain-containing protein [Fibrobacteria bacterium]|nr:phage tail sheath C-terminal domain-containing protein [Fibrobacteria bacterium]